ncbi:LuxR C-terminal-related transcriptional regulator [Microbacterium sp. BK668]|uniref:helix-turn-helix transcriptional regulator n=1 Tax=Microbacterium sp. BK668 TaxID=2512118 RepID=UPI00105D937F|nr:LuxR C-terminal-related transcriptional regulator [Microbacterium sp. BK668]TDN91597.1 regulatory LuxR family protein [Microbacterium sp. BK668]
MTLLGRQAELTELQRLLRQGARFVGVVGRAGVGKSAMLAELADSPPPGMEVWDVDLAGAPADAALLDEAARRLGLVLGRRFDASGAGGVDAIAARVGRRRVVLALDNSDGLALDDGTTAGLLRRCPGLTLLLARRRPPDERIALISLHPLEVPDRGASIEQLAANPSVRLFVDRAARADERFQLTDGNAHDVADVCRLVGGLPLAIELAAARVRIVSPARLSRELRDGASGRGLDLLSAGIDGMHPGIREALASTCAELAPRERRLLELLSGFSGPFPFEAAVSLGGFPAFQTLDDLERLVDLHLVEPATSVAGDRVFGLLPIVRAYVQETQHPVEGDDRRRRQVLRDLLDRATAASRSGGSVSDVTAAQVMRRDLVNEARRLMDQGADGVELWLVGCAEVLTGFAEGEVISELLDRVIASGELGDLDQETRARVLLWSSYLLAISPDGSGVAETVRRRLRGATELVDARRWPLLSLQTKFLGMMCYVVTGDLASATRLAAEGAAEAESLPSPVWAARFSVWLAAAAHAMGDLAGAISLAVAALERGSRLHDSYTLAGAAVILYTLPPGSVPDSIPLPPLEEALALTRARGDVLQEGFVLAALTTSELDAGRFHAAARWCAERLAQGGKRGWSLDSEISLVQTVLIAVGLGDLRFAARMLGAVRSDRERVLRAMAPRHREALDAAQQAVTRRLGAVASSLVGAGQLLSLEEAGVEATSWLKLQAGAADPSTSRKDATTLSPREREVLRLLAEGESNKQIATHLGLSVKTVMHHSVSIYRKLAVRGRAEAAAYAYRGGLLVDS